MFRTISLAIKLSIFILVFLVFCLLYSGEIRAITICYCRCSVTTGGIPVCQWMECEWSCAEMPCPYYYCEYCSSCPECFSGETGIQLKTENSKPETKEIKELEPGDVVESFNPETGEFGEGTVEGIRKRSVEGYYLLETESGKKVKVTAEHPFLAVKNQESVSQVSNFKNQFKDFLSHTLTYQLLSGLQTKIAKVF